MVHALRKSVVAIGLGLPLTVLAVPLRAAVSRALGTLRSGNTIQVDNVRAQGQCTLYSGDRVSTEAGPATVSFPGGDLLVMYQQSRAVFERTEGRLVVNLEKGGLSFNASSGNAARVESGGLTFTHSGSFPGLAEVALREDGSLVLAVHQGTIAVSNLRPEPVVVEAGHYLRVSPRLAQAVGTAAHGRQTLGDRLRTFQIGGLSHAASVAVLGVTLGVLTAAAIAVPLATAPAKASPSVP